MGNGVQGSIPRPDTILVVLVGRTPKELRGFHVNSRPTVEEPKGALTLLGDELAIYQLSDAVIGCDAFGIAHKIKSSAGGVYASDETGFR
jgi:hypothetical protein